MNLKNVLCLVSQVLLVQDISAGRIPNAPTVTIDSGVVVGTSTNIPGASPVVKYLGIPYAAPVERFSPPMRPAKWDSPLNATAYGQTCIQAFVVGGGKFPEIVPARY